MTPKINRSEVSFEVAQVLSEGRLAHFNVVFRGFRFGTLLSWVGSDHPDSPKHESMRDIGVKKIERNWESLPAHVRLDLWKEAQA